MLSVSFAASAQKYADGLIDKSVAVVGNEMISISQIEEQVQMMRVDGVVADRNMRCEILEQMLESKLLLMQARLDSLEINHDMVEAELSQRMDHLRSRVGGDENIEVYFGKPLYKLRQEWRSALEDQSLTQKEQSQIAQSVPELTPYDVKEDSIRKAYMATFFVTDSSEKGRLLAFSAGNHEVIEKFLEDHPDARALELLKSLSNKDMIDVTRTILDDSYNASDAILCPRVENEFLSPYKSFFAGLFGTGLSKEELSVPSNVAMQT